MSKKGKKVWERVYNERTSYLMLLPNIIMFAVFTVYPILWALRYMLFDYRGYGEAKFVEWTIFVRVFTRRLMSRKLVPLRISLFLKHGHTMTHIM